jgi:hypothetical protein
MKQPRSKERPSSLAALALFLLPMLAYWAYSLFLRPAPHYDGIDPEYEYFLNSLAIFQHQPYAYIDHPGTPVEMIGTALLAGTYPWLAGRPGGFADFHLRNPQLFLNLAYAFLIAAHVACAVVFYRLARGWSRTGSALAAAALATMYFAIQPYAFSGSLLWSHNSFAFPFGTLLLIWLCAIVMRPEQPAGRLDAQWVGLGVGVGVLTAITIFFAAWALGVLVVIVLYYGIQKRVWKDAIAASLAFGLSCIVGFYAGVLPVISKMGGFWNWIYGILSHQSNYLAVPRNQGMPERLADNAISFFQMLPVLAIATVIVLGLAAAALMLWRERLRQQPGLSALAGGLSVQLIALIFVFLDRPLRAYYFLSVAAVVPVLALLLLRIYEARSQDDRTLVFIASAAVFIGLVVNSAQAIAVRASDLRMQAASQRVVEKVIVERAAQLGRPPEDLTILWMYGTYSDCWGLWFANQRAGDAFDREIARICPNQYELAGRVLVPNAKVALEDFDWDIVFTCERHTDAVLSKQPAAEARVYPQITWTCGRMAAVLNR